MRCSKLCAVFLSAWALFGITACGGGGSGGGSSGSGTLALSLTDASTDRYSAVYITIDEVQVHLGGNENSANNWDSVDLPQSPMTLDLLQLVNGVREDLGIVNLPSGRYTQMRLIIGRTPDNSLNILDRAHPWANYLIDRSTPAQIHRLKIPSGSNSGFKIVNGFTIAAGETTELILDFDACRSVVEAGGSGNWLLKPTVKVAYTEHYSIVLGNVSDATGPVEGALVSLQVFDPAAADIQNRVQVEASTITDEFGYYMIFTAPGGYHMVAYKTGKQPQHRLITATAGSTVNMDVSLADADTGTVNGDIAIAGATAEQYATLSFRREITVGGTTVEIEIASLNIANNTPYQFTLPAGDYTLVASSFGYATVEHAVVVVDGGTARQDINL